MRKIKIEDRLENAVNAFFETDADKNANALLFADDAAILRNEAQTTLTEKAGFWTNIARQVFLFLPGAFFLYLTTLSTFFFLPAFGSKFKVLFWFLASGFLCWVGLGSLKNTKNLLVPATIVLFSAFAVFVFSLFPEEMKPALYFEYSIYLFPLVLIGSKLLQNHLED